MVTRTAACSAMLLFAVITWLPMARAQSEPAPPSFKPGEDEGHENDSVDIENIEDLPELGTDVYASDSETDSISDGESSNSEDTPDSTAGTDPERTAVSGDEETEEGRSRFMTVIVGRASNERLEQRSDRFGLAVGLVVGDGRVEDLVLAVLAPGLSEALEFDVRGVEGQT